MVGPRRRYPINTVPEAGDWGGVVFRNGLDYDEIEAGTPGYVVHEQEGVFLNYVNFADMRYGGGVVRADSIEQPYAPIYMNEARVTASNNVITSSANAALSADPNSFRESEFHDAIDPRAVTAYTADYDRVGPELYGNRFAAVYATDSNGEPAEHINSLNGVFVRIDTPFGDAMNELEVPGRFDDRDIVHIITENLQINGTPGGLLRDADGSLYSRQDARLAIDPGVIIKLRDGGIEAEMGAQLIAEAVDGYPIVLTSLTDQRYGAGGTFDTNESTSEQGPEPGDWGGLLFNPFSTGSVDRARIFYGGRTGSIEGGFGQVNTIEVHQAKVRVANSLLQFNAASNAGDRVGRGSAEPATIFVRGAQPIIVDNIIRDNEGPIASFDANAMQAKNIPDWGRSTGLADRFDAYGDNHGPLVRENRTTGNAVNGMVIRGGALTTETTWDDTDIVHVLYDEIIVLNHHTYSGLRLQSSADERLVVKLSGGSAGLSATGSPQEINDRIGGTLQIIGAPGNPVVFTSLADDSIGAGFDPDGFTQTDTDNARLTPSPGDWRSILIDKYSNDRNVETILEREAAYGPDEDLNGAPDRAELLGDLAPHEKASDDNLRLGFIVKGWIRLDQPGDVDVYSFNGTAGSEVWIDIDRSTFASDMVVELIDAEGNVLAGSNDTPLEDMDPSLMNSYGEGRPMDRDSWLTKDFYSINPRDPGFRMVLPGPAGEVRAYYVRVRTSGSTTGDYGEAADPELSGVTRGQYEMQIRLRELQEMAGSTVRFADIRYATNGIEVRGLPTHSPLLVESMDIEYNGGTNDTFATAQYIGNVLYSDRNTIAVAGNFDEATSDMVDWYRFDVEYEEVQSIPGINDMGTMFPIMFDLDYADGMSRPDIDLFVFDSTGTLILSASESNLRDDQPLPVVGAEMDNLSRGSFGGGDPTIGTITVPEGGGSYYVAVVPRGSSASVLGHSLARLEPIDSVRRPVEDHIMEPGNYSGLYYESCDVPVTLFEGATPTELNLYADDWNLGDVAMYVTDGADLYTYNPFTGTLITDVSGPGSLMSGQPYVDIAMRNDGRLYGVTDRAFPYNYATNGNYNWIDTGNAANPPLSSQDDEIELFQVDLQADPPALIPRGGGGSQYGLQYQAFEHEDNTGRRYRYAVANANPPGTGVEYTKNLMYLFDDEGHPIDYPGNDGEPRITGDVVPYGMLITGSTITVPDATDTDPPYPTPADPTIEGEVSDEDVLDATQLTILGTDGNQYIFELDSGPDVRMDADGPLVVRDGQTFSLGATTFEFDSGPMLLVDNGSTIFDGDSFTIRPDGVIEPIVFEFDTDDETVIEDAVAIPYVDVHTVQQVMQTVIDVINDQDDLTADGYVTGGVGRIVLTNDASVTVESEVRSIRIDGAYGPKDPANAPIPFEETMAQAAFGNSIVSVVSAYLPNVLASYADLPDTSGRGDRLTFQGAGDYDGTEARATASIVPRAGNFELPLIAYPDWGGAADQIEFTIEYADIGRRAWAGFNPIGNRIVLQVDPFETYATQILTALQIEGHFTHDDTGNTFGLDQLAVFDQSAGALAGGTGFLPAQLAINPNGTDNEFIVEAATPGAGFNGVEVVFHPSDFGGDAASAVYDGTTTLTINYDPFFTTAQTIADEIFNNVPEFTAYLSGNPANNDGTGLIQINTPVAVSAGGFGVPTWEQVDGRHGDLSVTGIDGDIAIPFGAGDTARELMERIAAEIRDSLGLDAVVQGPFIVIDGGGVVEVDPPLEFTGGGPGGDVTGMALIGDQMFAVSDRGGFYEVMDWRVGNSLPESDWGFRPVNPEEGYKHIELRVDSGPNLRYITTITDPDTGEAIPFSGLAPGPENVEQSVYQPMLFATSDDGSISTSEHLYAFDSQTAALQPIFHDGALSLDLGLTTIEGLDFSNIDFNMWHVTGNRSGDAGHGVNPSFNRSRGGSAGGTSFYFGLESPNTISGGVHAAAAADYVDQSSDFLYSYDVPGGAHGTLTTEPFSLAGYEPTDNPLLYFNYYLETQNDPQLDGARVYISSDSGAQWTPLAGNGGGAPLQEFATDGGSGWRQARISLAGYVGLDDLRLRFDFSTGGDLNIGNPATAGAYLRGLEGTELDDGDQFTIDGVTFEFDMGAALYLPNVAGHVIGDGESFTVTAGGDTVTFEFDNPDAPGYTPGVTADVAIDIGYGYMTDDVLLQMRDAVNSALPAVTAEISKHRLMLGGAEQVTQSPGAAIDAEGNGAGIGGPLADVLVPITQDMTAEQVAVAMADAIDLEFAGSPMPGTYVASKQDGSLIHVIGHMVDDPGLLPFANLLPGDSGQFFSNARGQDNRYEGFYIDDIIIGLAERGEMVTGVTPNEAVSLGAGEITAGEYQLEIRRAQDYGVYDPVLDLLVLDDSFHTNDRLIDQLTINAPEVDWIDHLDTFTVSDGWNERTYQFIGREGFTELPGGDASYIPVTYEGDWTAAEVANEIVAAINATENFNIVADSIETSRRVDLFGAAWVAGIDQVFFGDESESVFETDFPSGALSIDQAVNNLDPTAGTRLRDEILGEGVTAVGGASYVGGAASSGFWSDGLRSGILLTTGDASNAAEPNWYPIPNRSGDASLAGDPDLDAEFGVTTLDTSSLEFDFELDGDTLYFDVIFASEQYFDPLALGPDVVAFFLDGKNVGLVPDSDMPISIETINCQTNLRHFFQNTTGPASDLLSYNGYTTFLQMKVQGVEPGTHTIKLAISDVADALTDSAIFIPTGSFSTKPSGRPYRVDRVSTEYGGDPNADIRDQGQLILHSNQILHSAEYGISVDTGTREEESGWAHPSSPGALRELNTRRLVPGITIENNVVAYGEIGGIHFSGDTNPAGTPLAAVPFGRIVNNTVYGSATPATFRSADPTVTTT